MSPKPRGARRTKHGGPTEGGSGGKRGHSNMEHWGYTAEVKESTRRRRRAEDKLVAADEFEDTLDDHPADGEAGT